ncbi:hypothetical protein GOODEAATRI_019799 [Goodea atripinnis]|uniref:Uncharacterized protein n=1 Tax=Goodea atripinnis TaxID=208336 RepID=A0ABV0NLM5_9TELE
MPLAYSDSVVQSHRARRYTPLATPWLSCSTLMLRCPVVALWLLTRLMSLRNPLHINSSIVVLIEDMHLENHQTCELDYLVIRLALITPTCIPARVGVLGYWKLPLATLSHI